jgi:RND superfamily putative drug exporter
MDARGSPNAAKGVPGLAAWEDIVMTAFTRWVLGHKLLIAAGWLIVTLVGFAFVQKATNSLSQQFSLPGQQAYETNLKIIGLYGNGGYYAPLVPVITLPPGVSATSPAVRARLATIFATAARELPFARVASYASTGNRAFISQDGRTTFGLIFLPPAIGFHSSPGLHTAQSFFARQSIDGAHFQTSGLEPLTTGSGNSGGPSVLVEALLGGLGALIVLALVFRSFMALIPLLMAVIAIPTTFLVVWGLTTITPVSFIVQFLIALIGLGVAIDYSLLIVIRWREEHAKGVSNVEAVQRAMERAGLAVVFSGTTVAIGLLALVALPVPFLRSVGYGGMLIPLVSVLVALTVLPVILATIGPKIDWPRPKDPTNREAGHWWMAWGRLVVRHRVVAAGVALAILFALLLPLFALTIGTSRADSLAKSGPAYLGLKALEHSGIGAGALTPIEILTPATTPLVHSLTGGPGLTGVVSPRGPTWMRNGTRIVLAIPTADGSSAAGIDALNHLKSAVARIDPTARVGGYAAENQAFVSSVYGNFPIMIALIVVVTFLLLARAFRSLLLPLKAVVLNVLSVGAAWGVMTLVWQDGYGSKPVWGIASTGSITAWVPLMVFAFLFGLSMDYEVFILSRTREEYDRTGSTDEAITLGIGKTGRLVTSAALILFLAFVSLGTAPLTDIKVLATGLAVGILLDATVIRSLLVPSLVSLFGRWNWWLPAMPARLLRVQPSEPRPEPARAA